MSVDVGYRRRKFRSCLDRRFAGRSQRHRPAHQHAGTITRDIMQFQQIGLWCLRPSRLLQSRTSPPLLTVDFVPLCLRPQRLAPRDSVSSAYTFGGASPDFPELSFCQRFFCLRDVGRFPLRQQLSLFSPANTRGWVCL